MAAIPCCKGDSVKLSVSFSLILLCFLTSAYASTINAASCSTTDVQTAINSAANGDTVNVPSGVCTWGSQITIPKTKGVLLQGAGIGVTVITDSYAADSTLLITVQSGNAVNRVTGFTFIATASKPGSVIEVHANGDCDSCFRVDHNLFDQVIHRSVIVSAQGHLFSGLLDHNTINKSTSSVVQGFSIYGAVACSDGSSGDPCNDPFSFPIQLGTSRNVFIEDNTFNFTGSYPDGAMDNYGGSRVVFRHNTIIGTYFGNHGADSGPYRGQHTFEFYDNTFTNSNAAIFIPIFLRSGTGMIFNNTITGNYNGGDHSIELSNYRSCTSYSPWGKCDGTSAWDENQTGATGYACLDQAGHVFTHNQGGSNQLVPLYAWKNTLNGAEKDTKPDGSACNENTAHNQADRDYYNYTATFDGTSGVGQGLLSARPASCTPLTAYFATDTNTLYQCASPNTWTTYYAPYTYPHPLQSGDPPPAPPTDLNAVVQ